MNGSSKILCLHGSQQTAEIFRTKLGNFVTKLRRLYTVVFADAPFECALRQGDDVATRTWFLRDKSKQIDPLSLETAIASIEQLWIEHGHFAGIIGFSMGGTLAAIIASHHHRFPGLRFILIAGAPDNIVLASTGSTICMASLHIAGTADALYNDAIKLRDRFPNAEFVSHDQGHIFPTKAAQQKQYLSFIAQHIDSISQTLVSSQKTRFNGEPIQAAVVHLCSSDENAAAQREEIEVLVSIYPTELTILSPPPNNCGDICASFEFQLPPDMQLFGELQQVILSELRIVVEFTAGYPMDEMPVLRVNRGRLSNADFSLEMLNSLRKCLLEVMVENAGAPQGFACIQAMTDWVSNSNQISHNVLNVNVSAAVEGGEAEEEESLIQSYETVVSEDDDAQTSEWIRVATAESYAVAMSMRDAALEDDYAQFHEPPPPSARGVWRYTVGLVGKPSAGKSTFYNAVTRAALAREGRLMAAVAPHPFTTIEPNVGPGWYASSRIDIDGDERRTSLHGRDRLGRRLLPVIVKDVAGLVPGAYKGRGKGNRFLADLCDADVLIHVVDVTGKSDKDGNILGDADDDPMRSSPMEDAKWIREELHRWIHGNVSAKWSSVGRKDKSGVRVTALFSGYKGPKSCVEKACRRAGFDIDNGKNWSALDIHRLVAHYLTIRFPICLALNKIDMLPMDTALLTVAECQNEAKQRGENAVPISARAEAWVLLKQAAEDDGNMSRQLPTQGSKDWLSNQNCLDTVERLFGGTGVLDAISAAVSLRPPVLCYPVCDLDSEAPVGWSAGNKTIPQLRDCLKFKPGSTVGDVYDALKRGSLDHAIVTGDFVRAEGKGLEASSRKKQFGRDTMLDSSCAVLRVQTNRKVVWQSALKSDAIS